VNANAEFVDYYRRRYRGKEPVMEDVIDAALLDFYLIGRKDEKRKLVDLLINSDAAPRLPNLDTVKHTESNVTETKQQPVKQ